MASDTPDRPTIEEHPGLHNDEATDQGKKGAPLAGVVGGQAEEQLLALGVAQLHLTLNQSLKDPRILLPRVGIIFAQVPEGPGTSAVDALIDE